MNIDLEELSDEEIQAILQTPAFQKAAQYRRLAQGIEVLEEDDAIYQQLVRTIESRHPTVNTVSSIEETLDLLVEEVNTYTEDLGVDESDDVDEEDPLQNVIVDEEER